MTAISAVGERTMFGNLRRRREVFYSSFAVEFSHIRAFMNEYPILTFTLPFFLGLITGGVLSATVSQFVIISLVGGASFAVPYGLRIGLPVIVSTILVIPVVLFASYAVAQVLSSVDKHPVGARYLGKMKSKYMHEAKFLEAHAGKVGIAGALALCTFVIGWWVAITISYILEIDIRTTMKATALGLIADSAVSLASFGGLIKWVPNSLVVTAILMIVSTIMARIFQKVAKSEAEMGGRIRIG
jgi:uncharacterized membrane protein